MYVIRNLRPIDLVALAAFHGSVVNQAQPRSHLERGPEDALNVGSVLGQWVTVKDRKALIAIDGLTVRGFITARLRGSRTVWEVDRLIVEEESEESLPEVLLDQFADRASRSGAHRIFLRLPLDSPFMGRARRAGYHPYLTETLYRRAATTEVGPPEELPSWEAKTKDDHHALFRLYCAVAPQNVQAAEGLTLEEWQGAQDGSLGHQKDYIWTKDDQPIAWLRTGQGNHCGHIQLLIHPSEIEEGTLNHLIPFALSQMPKDAHTLALVPDYLPLLGNTLTHVWGFQEVTQYASLVRHLTLRVTAGRFVPART